MLIVNNVLNVPFLIGLKRGFIHIDSLCTIWQFLFISVFAGRFVFVYIYTRSYGSWQLENWWARPFEEFHLGSIDSHIASLIQGLIHGFSSWPLCLGVFFLHLFP